MNEGHCVCGSDEWRAHVRDVMIPDVVGTIDLGDDAIELGPGYGATTEVFRERVAHLTAVEIDPDLVARLVERFSGTNVDVVLGDATDLRYPDARFSAALSFSMLHHVPTPEMQDKLFSEACRVLQPGAVFVAIDAREDDGLREFHAGDHYNPIDPDRLPARLRAAGFRDVNVQTDERSWKVVAR
jgi:SAM-dependent methyltransferase